MSMNLNESFEGRLFNMITTEMHNRMSLAGLQTPLFSKRRVVAQEMSNVFYAFMEKYKKEQKDASQ